jgi:hypothetical protein
MKIGGKRRIFIPWQMAYGTRAIPDRPERPGSPASPGIPAKSDLIFDVELVDVTDAPQPPHPPMPANRPAPPATPAHPGASTQPGTGPTAPAVPAPSTAPESSPAPTSKAASNSNFEKVIAAYFRENSFCFPDTLGPKLSDYNFLTPGTYQVNAKMNDLFVRAGLLTLVSQNVNGNMMERQFALTPLGGQYYKTGIGWSKAGRGFCYGTPVVQVVDFTDPGPNGTYTAVTFKLRLKDLPTWLIGDLAQEFRDTNQASPAVWGEVGWTAHLTLMGSGWKVSSVE